MNSAPLLISALGGAVAALLLRVLFKLIGKWWVERKPLAIYKCADAHPAPLSEVHIGLLIHGKGLAIADDERASYGRSWEHTSMTAEGSGVHTIYGPYVNDFGKPGFYRVCFRIAETVLN